MTFRLVFLICVFWGACVAHADGGAQPECTGECPKSAIEHKSLVDLLKEIISPAQVPPPAPDPHKLRINDTFSEGWKGCPSLPQEFSMTGDQGKPIFTVKLQREKYVEQIPAKVVKNFVGHWVTQPAHHVEKEKCEIEFKKDCGSPTLSPVAKLDWLKTTLGPEHPAACEKAIEDFAHQCGPWAGLTDDQRKSEALRLVGLAFDNFKMGVTASNIPPPPNGRSPGVGPARAAEKNKNLSAHLLQCLMSRENQKFEPNKLNFTECHPVRDRRGQYHTPSSANGLFQIVESSTDYLNDQKPVLFEKPDGSGEGVRMISRLGNICYNFAGYWQKVLREKTQPGLIFTNSDIYLKPKTCGEVPPKDFVNRMSGSPEFQAAIGTAQLNYYLEMAEHYGVKENKKRNHGQIPPQTKRDAIIRTALHYYWFDSKDDGPPNDVIDCMHCLDQGKSGCLWGEHPAKH